MLFLGDTGKTMDFLGEAAKQPKQTSGIDVSGILGDVTNEAATAMLGPWGALVGGLFSSGVSLLGGDSPQEESMKEIMAKLEEAEEYLKSTPFTKDEIMNQLLPQAQRIYRGGADVAAAKAGAAVGESGVAKGQSFGEYYAGAIAPIIARGEEKAGDAISRFGQWFSGMDAQGKDRFIQSVRLLMGGTAGLSGMSVAEEATVSGLEGARIGGGIAGEFDILNQLQELIKAKQEFGKGAANIGSAGNVNVTQPT